MPPERPNLEVSFGGLRTFQLFFDLYMVYVNGVDFYVIK